MDNFTNINDELGKILIYQNEKGDTKIDAFFEEDTIWLSQKSIARLYQTTPQNITLHIKNIFKDNELNELSTCKNYLQVQKEGNREIARAIKHYNLDMILAIGYRVRSNVGNHFRNWASKILTEYMKKGFVLNDERLKEPKRFGEDYFDELLERIRDIRASEKRMYQKVKDIFSLSVDYDNKTEFAQKFFMSVQNKLEYAITGYTAPEIILNRADSTKDNMGLTSFKGAKVRKSDVTVAKNYLTQEEISNLNLIVNMYLDYAELMAKNKKEMYMSDCANKLDDFLKFNERDILQDFGKVTREIANSTAIKEYEKFDNNRRQQEQKIDFFDNLTTKAKNIKK